MGGYVESEGVAVMRGGLVLVGGGGHVAAIWVGARWATAVLSFPLRSCRTACRDLRGPDDTSGRAQEAKKHWLSLAMPWAFGRALGECLVREVRCWTSHEKCQPSGACRSRCL